MYLYMTFARNEILFKKKQKKKKHFSICVSVLKYQLKYFQLTRERHCQCKTLSAFGIRDVIKKYLHSHCIYRTTGK